MSPDTQTVISMAFPTLAILVGILVNNSRLTDFRSANDQRFLSVDRRLDDINTRFEDINRRFEDINRQFDGVNRRIDEMRVEMRDLIRLTSERHDSNLLRVEEVLDARLKHLEERER